MGLPRLSGGPKSLSMVPGDLFVRQLGYVASRADPVELLLLLEGARPDLAQGFFRVLGLQAFENLPRAVVLDEISGNLAAEVVDGRRGA
jgi:hypothetical protein